MAPPKKPEYTVAAEQEYAYYSRYPNGLGEWPSEAEDLKCPHCDAEEIICIDDSTELGSRVQCWLCKREFTITANCWKFRKIK